MKGSYRTHANVRFGSFPDLDALDWKVRIAPNNGL
jgi:hypothetical protein